MAAAALQPELNARQRKHVHMHSTIFSSDGPTTKSVYAPSRQQELYRDVKTSLRANNNVAPEIALPSAADIKCTQNAGHNVVIPARGAQESRPAAAGRTGPSPRTDQEVLVYDGEPHAVQRASGRDTEAIPKEFWSTSVNLQWHDTRNEQCRSRGQGGERKNLNAQDSKRHEMSSEIFGKARITAASTPNAKGELLADTANHLQLDSTLHGRKDDEQTAARERMQRNLTNSHQSTLAREEALQKPERVQDEDPEGRDRRRQEKNFSDIFGAKMGERKEIRGKREEITSSHNCSFLDSRGEIASRNKDHWRSAEDAPASRKQAQHESRLFDFKAPERPVSSPQMEEAMASERACWDSRGIIEASSEIARRQRTRDHMKDFHDDQSANHLSRKQDMMSSEQVKRNMQSPEKAAAGQSAAPTPQNGARSAAFSDYATSPRLLGAGARAGPGTPGEREQMLKSARETKIASLQSSIF